VVVGASDDQRKWGNWLARAALPGPRPVYLVNSGRDIVLGRPAYRSVRDVPGPVGLAAICVPAGLVAAAVDDALAAGARAIVVISAGFAETGPAGRQLEGDIADRVRAAGSVLLGPNCLGVFDAASGLCLTSNPLPSGPVAFLSQSGNLSLDLAGLLAEHGMGFSRFASLGNQADIGLPELIEACAGHAATSAVAIYCEQFTDGRRFVAAARDLGKPVVLLPAGSSAATARVAASHTGSLVTDAAVVAAACEAAGVHLVHSLGELADLLALLAAPARPAGRRLGILTDGGGHAAIAAELAARTGLAVPELPKPLRARVAAHLPGHAGTANPVDVAGGAEQDLACLGRVAADLLGSGEVDALLVSGYFGGYAEYGPELAAAELAVAGRLGDVMAETGRPVLVQTLFPAGAAAAALRARGIPVFRRTESAVSGLSHLAPAAPAEGAGARSRAPAAPSASTATQLAAAPELAAPPASNIAPVSGASLATAPSRDRDDGCLFAVARVTADRQPRSSIGAPSGRLPAGPVGYWTARQFLADEGIPFPAARLVGDITALEEAAGEIAPPWVLKASVPGHKSDAGGVRLGLADVPALRAAYAELTSRLGPGDLVTEEMIDDGGGAELIAGVRRDPRFGPIALVGLGGIYAETFADTQTALAPLRPGQALDLLGRLRGAALLTGARGRPRLAVEAAAELISLLAEVAAEHEEIAELEVNPVLVTTTGALALDARIITRQEDADDADGR